ncbi:hypothetical protein L195_g054239 [Trifolium pratense]|uniref:Uncharacterized protein n=1 Tax=Trifolium pratense TaxID=57577 RepID=A0A2K3KF10_TRIPR|nr:hypothetical protein L195_g054239 [Trifolium pratense]
MTQPPPMAQVGPRASQHLVAPLPPQDEADIGRVQPVRRGFNMVLSPIMFKSRGSTTFAL